jgi:TatD DNase family protein
MIFESHAHYEDARFDEDREALLKSFPQNGIDYVINVGSSLKTTKQSILLAEQYDFIYAAAGVHPEETAELNEENFAWLCEQMKKEKVVAVGEIGLDYHWDEPERSVQKQWFERQIALARQVSLPMIIHSRDAAKDTLDIMKACKAEEAGGVIHCFSYGVEMAREYLNMGFYIGIGGVVTFKNAKKLKEVAEYVPLDRILLETDCPYMAPEPHRGKRNSSLYLTYVAEKLADIKGMDVEKVYEKTRENGKRMYRIEK